MIEKKITNKDMRIANYITLKEFIYIIIGAHIFAFVWVFVHSNILINIQSFISDSFYNATLNKKLAPWLFLSFTITLDFSILILLSFISAIPTILLQVFIKPVRITRCAITISIILISIAYLTNISGNYLCGAINEALGVLIWGIFIYSGLFLNHKIVTRFCLITK